ncbi:2-oxoadipate dioxygenase/decarboxylase family protein, partial [Merismopedia glauca]
MNGTKLAQQLWDTLWENYRDRVPYASMYQKMIEDAGGAIANDHIAFRSLRLTTQNINLGIPYLAKIIEPLGYEAVGEYKFPDSHLLARHYEPSEDLPKLFISELIVDEL